MSFLQPMLLAALPLISLPIIIHLINQRRYQTINWAAMMFLLAANRMSRGYARLRQWLILLFRTIVIAGLIFAVSRPLASGWVGLATGGRADTTIILLDRSPSMQQQSPGAVLSKLETGKQQLVQTLKTLGSSHWVLIESATNQPRTLESPDALLNLPVADPTSASADLPAMLQSAQDYIKENQSGRTEVWICSDLRENDWNAEESRWPTLRNGFLEFTQGVRFHLLAYPQTTAENVAVRVTGSRWRQTDAGAELLMSLRLTRTGESNEPASIPIQFEIGGARSEVTVEMTGADFEMKDYRIALESNLKRGWGRVTIPADANPADNDFYFTFDQPPPRRAIIVTDVPQSTRPLELAASISHDRGVACTAGIIPREQLATVEWEQVALLLWQAPLPRGDLAKDVEAFVERGGQVMFFPSNTSGDEELFGTKWLPWEESNKDIAVENWRGDQDLLSHTLSGAALPVGKLRVSRFRGLAGDLTPLATLQGGAPLVARVTTNHGGVYFCTTTAEPRNSSLATDGVVLYVAIQRAMAAGAAVLGHTQQLVAGKPSADNTNSWERLSGTDEALSTEYPFHRGVYEANEQLLAVNRPSTEEQASVLADARVTELFQGLDFVRLDDQAGNVNPLVEEIWRLFLATMMVAMVVEAGLCLPKKRSAEGAAS